MLDIGCGNGYPLTGTLLEAGHRVIGLDSSREMLTRFRGNLPSTPIVRGIAQACAFADHEASRDLLRQNRLVLLDVHKDCGENTYYVARKAR